MRTVVRSTTLALVLLTAGSSWASQSCSDVTDCWDGNSCTTDACVGNVCTWTADTPCGPFIDNPVAGKKLKLRIPPTNQAANGIRFLATGGVLNSDNLPDSLSTDNPYNTGGSLRVFTTMPPGGGFDHTYALPPSSMDSQGRIDRHWDYYPSNRPADHRGYQYKDAFNEASPIGVIVITAGKTVKLKGKDNMPFTLDGDPDPVQVVLTLGRYRYCWSMGLDRVEPIDPANAALFKLGQIYWAKNSPAPDACP